MYYVCTRYRGMDDNRIKYLIYTINVSNGKIMTCTRQGILMILFLHWMVCVYIHIYILCINACIYSYFGLRECRFCLCKVLLSIVTLGYMVTWFTWLLHQSRIVVPTSRTYTPIYPVCLSCFVSYCVNKWPLDEGNKYCKALDRHCK